MCKCVCGFCGCVSMCLFWVSCLAFSRKALPFLVSMALRAHRFSPLSVQVRRSQRNVRGRSRDSYLVAGVTEPSKRRDLLKTNDYSAKPTKGGRPFAQGAWRKSSGVSKFGCVSKWESEPSELLGPPFFVSQFDTNPKKRGFSLRLETTPPPDARLAFA